MKEMCFFDDNFEKSLDSQKKIIENFYTRTSENEQIQEKFNKITKKKNETLKKKLSKNFVKKNIDQIENIRKPSGKESERKKNDQVEFLNEKIVKIKEKNLELKVFLKEFLKKNQEQEILLKEKQEDCLKCYFIEKNN